MWLLRQYSGISFFTYGTIAMAVCIGVGYFVSLATGGTPKDLTGLTLWTPRPADMPAPAAGPPEGPDGA
jgi:hypothetical protein